MFWVILTCLSAVVSSIATLVFVFVPQNRMAAGVTAAVTAVVWLGVSAIFSMHTVGQRQVGIVYNFSGTITGKKNSGLVMTAPWQRITKENVGIQSEEFDLDASNSAVSQDQQPVYARLFLNFQVEPAHVVDLYKSVGPQWKHILLDARVLQDFKEVTATYAASQITANRNQLRAETRARLEAELRPYDVRVVDFFVKNVAFSAAYNGAITSRNVQVQRALQAQAKVAQVEAEAKQRIAAAQGEARANTILTNSISDRLLRLKAIEKLNPNVQTIYVPSDTNLFLTPSGK